MTPAMPAQLRGERQVATPARGIDAAALLDHDHVTRLRRLDGRRPQVTRRHRAPVVCLELHRHHAAGDPPIGGEALMPDATPCEPKLVERIRYGAGIESAETRRQYRPYVNDRSVIRRYHCH